jgi:hypothetical protein
VTQPRDGFVVQFGILVEITLMPVDIAKAYFEILELRKEVQKAELAYRISFARPPGRPRHAGRTNARGSQAINSQAPLLKRGRN